MSHKSLTKLLYHQEQLPVFQNRMYATKADAISCPKGDVVLVEDQKTGLIYNEAFRPDLMVYDDHYQNEQAFSPIFRQHLESVSNIIDRCMGRVPLVEVGCGKGFFLELMQEKGFDVTGFDPTYEGDNPKVHRYYFQPSVGMQSHGLILRHVLEHIQNPVDFLIQLKDANGGVGKIYIEVPCFDWICDHRAFFDVFYEHVNYFRISDFRRMFGTVIESGRLFGGQYLYVVANLATLRRPSIIRAENVRFPKNFTRGLATYSVDMGSAAVWGGSSKGVIFCLLKERAGQPISTVIDINPAKQGKYLPSTGLRVQSSKEALTKLPRSSTIFVMNSNYLDEIKEMSKNTFQYIEVDHGCFPEGSC